MPDSVDDAGSVDGAEDLQQTGTTAAEQENSKTSIQKTRFMNSDEKGKRQ
jgi:hypothetical protein